MNILEEYLDSKNVIYTIFSDKKGRTLQTIGDISNLEFSSIADQYFGSEEKIKATCEFLKGKVLPQTVMQGKVCCIITEINENIIAGVFIHDENPVLERRKITKQINCDLLNFDINQFV